MSEDLLSPAEQTEQAKRCPCHGSDDYCPCQNAADAVTRRDRTEALREALGEMIAWGTEPEPGTKSLREDMHCRAWAMARAALADAKPIPERDEYGRLARHRDDFDDDAGQFPTR